MLRICAIVLASGLLAATAAPRIGRSVPAANRACGGPHGPAAILLRGTIVEGGSPGAFTKIVDLRDGRSITTERQGVQTSEHGYNGMPWYAANGTIVRVDAPPYVANARTDAFVDRLAWTTGARDPSVHVHLGTSGRADSLAIDADQGTHTVALSDWRCVSGVAYPFEQTTTRPTGDTTVVRIQSLEPIVPTATTFAPPPPRNHGTLAGSEAEVPFAFASVRDPHIVVHASVDGHDATLIFDTGADSYLGTQSAKAWGLGVSGGIDFGGAGAGTINGGFVHVDTLGIGGALLHDQFAVVAPLPWPSSPGAPDGLTGFQFFTAFRTTIDYQNRILRFESLDAPPAPAGAATLPFSTDGDGHMYVWASVNGTTGLFLIDTGDHVAITLFDAFSRRAGVTGLDAAASNAGGAVGGSVSAVSTTVPSFTLGENALTNVDVKVAKMSSGFFASKSIAGNLGGGLLRCFALTIDYRNRTLTFAHQPDTENCLAGIRADGPSAPGTRRSSGR